MLEKPFFDPNITYAKNLDEGPFGAFADHEKFENEGEPEYEFMGNPVHLPFGIPAGPLLNGRFVKAALDKGFDIATYKTVRTRQHPTNDWPNVLAVKVDGDLTLEKAEEGLVGTNNYEEPIAITNSFGVPSYDPDIWQPDMADAAKHAKKGQVVIGSLQGTTNSSGSIQEYIEDFALGAKLVKETGVKIVEANTSCPNEGDSHLLCFDLPRTQKVSHAIKEKIGNTPLIIKIAYFESQEQLRRFVGLMGNIVDGISAINTIAAKIFDEEGNQALPGTNRLKSGVCGYPIKWAGLDMVGRLRDIRDEMGMDFTIIGVGGLTTPADYHEYIDAGADAAMSATGAMWNPFLAQQIKSN